MRLPEVVVEDGYLRCPIHGVSRFFGQVVNEHRVWRCVRCLKEHAPSVLQVLSLRSGWFDHFIPDWRLDQWKNE